MKKSIIFPGQGSQYPGMGKYLHDNFDYVKKLHDEVNSALDLNLTNIIFDTDNKEAINLTQNTQPAIMLTSYTIFTVLKKEKGIDICNFNFCAGHSLGEYTALLISNSLKLADTAKILFNRGKFMQQAAPVGEGAMIAVLNVECNEVEKFINENNFKNVEISNDNCPGQIVLSGKASDVKALAISFKNDLKKKSVPLPVSAPFHCTLMKKAEEEMKKYLANVVVNKPSIPIISNFVASAQNDPTKIKELLIKQICGRVRWRESILYMNKEGINKIVEIGPSKTLTNMMKRFKLDLKTINLESIDDIKNYD